MSGVDRGAAINYLVDSMRVLHAEDQALKRTMARVRETRTIGPDEFEALGSAQSTALRIPANALLMLVGLLDDTGAHTGAQLPPPTCDGRWARRLARLGKFLDALDGL